jgi:predicted RNase H-like HicB family nuclease
MRFRVEVEQEDDGRWLADVVDLPGVMAYGATVDEALSHVQALALRVHRSASNPQPSSEG